MTEFNHNEQKQNKRVQINVNDREFDIKQKFFLFVLSKNDLIFTNKILGGEKLRKTIINEKRSGPHQNKQKKIQTPKKK